MPSEPLSGSLREEVLRLHGGVRVALEEAGTRGDIAVIEDSLRQMERRLCALLQRPEAEQAAVRSS